jgi:hypothetical protein
MVVFLLCLLIGGPAFAQADKLEGVWSVTETILSACPTGDPVRTFPDMNEFIRGGTMVEASATLGIGAPPLVRLNPGLGTWDHIAARHFTEHFTFFRYDPGTDAFAGVQVINKDIELSKDGNAFASTGTADIFDANGNPIATRCTMATAVRIN